MKIWLKKVLYKLKHMGKNYNFQFHEENDYCFFFLKNRIFFHEKKTDYREKRHTHPLADFSYDLLRSLRVLE